MRETCIRTKVKFIGDRGEYFTIKQMDWIRLLPLIDKGSCLKCLYGEIDFCQPWIEGSIDVRVYFLGEASITEVTEEGFFLFNSIQDAEVFSKMLFYLWNNDGSTVELDYEDLCQYFSSSKNSLRPIKLLPEKELLKMQTGNIVCFSLCSSMENAMADIYKTANQIDNIVGTDVNCLFTDLAVPKISNREMVIFHVEK